MSLAALVAAAVTAVAPTPEAPIVVDGKPISRGYLRHFAEVARRSSSSSGPIDSFHRWSSASLLIYRRWMMGEAAERGIVVTREDVTAEFRSQRTEAFPRWADYRRMLRDTGQSTRDVRMRVRLSVYGDRLFEQETAGIEEGRLRERAIRSFLREWRQKWRPRTACRTPWVVRYCRNR